jgi:hypothetical protein
MTNQNPVDTALLAVGTISTQSVITGTDIKPTILIIVALMAPIVKELGMYAIDKLINKIKEKRNGTIQ